jgi:catechol 2,3-dioxygenase-like lactoylglutathione lyase family enzyme
MDDLAARGGGAVQDCTESDASAPDLTFPLTRTIQASWATCRCGLPRDTGRWWMRPRKRVVRTAYVAFMACQLVALSWDANDPHALATFWAAVLGREMVEEVEGGCALLPNTDTEFRIEFFPTEVPKSVPNQMHFDLTSASPEEQQATVAKAEALGARHIDVGQLPEETHVVLADPEGNEFDVIAAGNRFLADTALIGALASDGSQACGYFWSEALGWPLVWDQDEETAIQSPQGGTKITWGGPPLAPKTGKYRLHFDIAPPLRGDQQVEVDRLLALGATHVDIGQGAVDWVVLADPDGHEFCVLTPR